MKKFCVFIYLGLLFSCSAFGQTPIPEPPQTIQSPTAASIAEYGDIPVSLYTGAANIQIPLYTLSTAGGTSVPITLNYNSHGFRPDEHPGWVGSGWSLDAGGVITRTVKDMPDDYSNSNYYLGSNAGYYFNHSVLNTSNWNYIPFMKTIAEHDSCLKDTETDEYSFSFPGGNGKFYLDATGNWAVKCDKPVKVVFNGQFLNVPFTAPIGTRMSTYGNSKTYSGFTLIDEDGNQYVFGGTTDAIEYSIGFFSQNQAEWQAQAWYLTKIIPARGSEINFTYTRGNFINQMFISIYNNLKSTTVNSAGILNPTPSCSSNDYRTIGASYSGMLIAPVYLDNIQTNNYRINFASSLSTELRYSETAYSWNSSQWTTSQDPLKGYFFLPILSTATIPNENYPQCLDQLQWRKLDSVSIYGNSSFLRKFSFTYNNTSGQRLFLNSLTESDADNVPKPPYTFTYDNSVSLPPYLANETDHWGFYNGIYADISNQQTYYTTYYSYREPNATYLYAGTLNKIVYPTGGSTEFTYEPNQYNKRLAFNRTEGIDQSFNTKTMAGGLRIKKITSYDINFPNSKKTKEYFYVNGYTYNSNPSTLPSSGVLGGQSKYYFDDYRVIAFNDNNVVYSKSVFSSQSVLPACNNTNGSFIGYSEVTEKESDGSYTNYYYSNFDNGHIDESAPSLQQTRTAYDPYTSLDAERGNLLRKEVYSDRGILVQKKVISYVALNKQNSFVPSLFARFFNVCPGTSVSAEEGVAYKNYTYSYLPQSDTTIEYDNEGKNPVKTINNYTYNTTYRLLTNLSKINSKGESITTNNKYPFDYSSGIFTTMINKNIIAPVIEQTTTLHLYYTQTQLMYSKVNYAQFTSKNLILPQSVQQQTQSNPLETRELFNSYDTSGNLLEFQKYDDTRTVYLWGYKGAYPVAEIIGSDYATVNGVVTQSQIDNAISQGDAALRSLLNGLRTNSQTKKALITTYTYKPGVGMTSETDPQGRTTYYEYDSFQRLSVIKDFNNHILKTYNYHYGN